MLSIEFEPASHSTCTCCGGRTTRLTRFVSEDGDAYAVYFADFSENHPERYVSVLISIGTWGEGTSPSGRQAFFVWIRSTDGQYQVSVRDVAESPWGDVPFLGRSLDREEALAHPRIQDVFHITDHIVEEDRLIIEYLS